MCASQTSSSLDFELRIIRAKNIEFATNGNLFVRCYLSAGNKGRIRLNSREISSTCDPYWNETFSLQCSGTETISMEEFEQQSVLFELRQRNTVPIIGRIGGSKLLGRAQVSWKEALESSDLAIEKWIAMVSRSSNRVLEGLNPPAVQVGMKVQVSGTPEMPKRRRDVRPARWNECGCRHGRCNDGHDDFFALAAALEAL